MATLIPASTTQFDSVDIPLTEGQTATLALMPAAGQPLLNGCHAEIQRKTGTDYITIGELHSYPLEERIKVLNAKGTYRVRKLAGPNFGIDKD